MTRQIVTLSVPGGVKPGRMFNGRPVKDTDTFRYDEASPGDYVTHDVVEEAMDCLPPACYCDTCSQMGEPYTTRLDEETGQWRNTYHTFRKVGGAWPDCIWEYRGDCFYGEVEMRGKPLGTDTTTSLS